MKSLDLVAYVLVSIAIGIRVSKTTAEICGWAKFGQMKIRRSRPRFRVRSLLRRLLIASGINLRAKSKNIDAVGSKILRERQRSYIEEWNRNLTAVGLHGIFHHRNRYFLSRSD